MFTNPVIDLPRTIPNEEPVSSELPENENTFEAFGDEMVDVDLPEIEMPFQSKRGPSVRAPIYANPESRPERTLPRAAREQIESSTTQTTASDGSDPFKALMDRFNG
jgi:hypothetical protein